MAAKNLSAIKVAAECDIYPRTLTEYLAGRLAIQPDHLHRLSEFLGVRRDILIEPVIPNLAPDDDSLAARQAILRSKGFRVRTPPRVGGPINNPQAYKRRRSSVDPVG